MNCVVLPQAKKCRTQCLSKGCVRRFATNPAPKLVSLDNFGIFHG